MITNSNFFICTYIIFVRIKKYKNFFRYEGSFGDQAKRFFPMFYLQDRATAEAFPLRWRNCPASTDGLVCRSFHFTTQYPLESKQSFLIDKIGGRLRVSQFWIVASATFYECGKIHSANQNHIVLVNRSALGPQLNRKK